VDGNADEEDDDVLPPVDGNADEEDDDVLPPMDGNTARASTTTTTTRIAVPAAMMSARRIDLLLISSPVLIRSREALSGAAHVEAAHIGTGAPRLSG